MFETVMSPFWRNFSDWLHRMLSFRTAYVSAEACPQIRKCHDYRSYAYKQALNFQYIGPRVVLTQKVDRIHL